MENRHTLLKRQIKRHFGSVENVPDDAQAILTAVNEAYHEFDEARHLLERALDLSSRELFQANSELRGVLQALPDLLYRIEASGKLVDLTPDSTVASFIPLRHLGMDSDDSEANAIAERFRKAVTIVRTTGETTSFEYAERLNGANKYFEARLLPFVDGEIITIVRDVTDRKHAEEDLQRVTAQTEMILTSIPSVLIGVDENGLVITWSHAARTLFGKSAADVLGKQFDECGIQWDWARVLEAIALCCKSGRTLASHETTYTRADEKKGVLDLSINPITAHTGVSAGFVMIGTDITQRRILEAELAQSQKLESIGQLAAGIAHELNTPIQYVSDNTRFLKDSFLEIQEVLELYGDVLAAAENDALTPDMICIARASAEKADVAYLAEEIPAAVQQSLDGLDRVAHLVRAMKEFSHPGTVDKTGVDLNKMIDSTITVARNEWKYVSDVTTDFDHKLPLVHCLPGELNQVMLNMIVNAAHAIAESSGSAPDSKGCIAICTKHDGDWAEICISDTGAGIPDHVKKRIFDPFFTTKPVGTGTGQGLAICHSVIVDKHGGTIGVESEVGKGTTFRVRIPVNGNIAAPALAA